LQAKAPTKKAIAAKPPSKSLKPPAKPKLPPKKKILVEKDDNADDSIMDIDEVESDDETTGPSRPKEPAPPKKKKTASETYTKVRIQ
jgi:DNA topoisomerase-2